MKHIFFFILVIFLLFPGIAFSDSADRYSSTLGLQITPGVDIPLADSSTYFDRGIFAGLELQVTPPSWGIFNADVEFNYLNNPRTGLDDQLLQRFTLAAGGGVRLPLFDWLSLRMKAGGGYSIGIMDHDDGIKNAGIPVITASIAPTFEFLPWLDISVNASYQWYIGVSNSFSVNAGLTYRFKERESNLGPPVLEGLPPKLIQLEFDEIFPVFYSYYDNHPVGSAILLNPREGKITDINLVFNVKQYMDAPKSCTVPDSLGPGETGKVGINALFNNSVLGITEGTKVAAELTLSYKVDGIAYTDTYIETMRMQYRNAMTWDDDRRAAAFVTAKDPAIMSFAKNVTSMLHGRESRIINRNLQLAMAIHGALSLRGMTYVIDPTTSYAELSETEHVVDFLQFPRETLEYRGGDCDDLSILYSALFEALGIEAAFITVPGHIFIAFGLELSPREATRTFYNRDRLIIRENKVWVPLEITATQEPFMKAWDLGSRQWNEHEPEGRVGFFPIRDAWKHYEPVGLPGEPAPMGMPQPAEVVSLFETGIEEFIQREMAPQEEKLKSDIQKGRDNPGVYNKLGVLYARYGKLEEAAAQFEAALQGGEYISALINIGNIRFLQEKMDEALEYYRRAEKIKPDNSKILLSLARTAHALGHNAEAVAYYEKLKAEVPELAARLAYLDGGTGGSDRSADGSRVLEAVIWDEDWE